MKDSTADATSPESHISKLLSIVITGRDDDYMLDFRYRIGTTLNYVARNLKQLGRLDDVEIVVTDWGSEIPLAQTLSVSPEARQICRFVYVPLSVVHAVQNGGEGFHTTISYNSAFRRARGKFLMQFYADTLIPQRSLEVVLRLLDGKLNLPIALDHTCFLCSRYHVPWQFLKRQPNLDEWDRYLLLHAGEYAREKAAVFSISSGIGAVIMHHLLWHQLRGLDERLGGWGMSDVELGLRVTQYCPWVELSSLGVSLFHMEHSPYDRRGSVKQQKRNPHIYNPIFHVNDENWGLGNHELEIQTAQNIRGSVEAPAESFRLSHESESQKVEWWYQSRREVLAELTSEEVHDHVRRITELFLTNWAGWNIDSGEMDALFLLSWYSKYHYPRRYLEFGVGQGYTAAAVGAACPSVEIYGIDKWEGVLYSHTPIAIAERILRRSVAHHGYVRFINGDICTAVQRLQNSFVGPFFFDLVLVRGDLLGEDATEQVSELLLHLAAGGALVFTCKSADRFVSVWDEIRRRLPHFTYIQCRNCCTGLVLAASLRGSGLKGREMENLLFDASWIRVSRTKCQLIRLYRTSRMIIISNPAVRRVYRWVRQ